MTAQVAIALVLGLAASIEDVALRRISNWIPVAGLVSGLGWHCAISGWRGILTAVLGAGAGFGVFLVFYILGGMGGGDIKLMAGLGSLLGPGRLLEAALWTAAAGGMIALGYLGVRAVRRKPAGKPPVEEKASIPYAPAIAIGAWLSLVPKG
jgi:prepilin peptidase CpaA